MTDTTAMILTVLCLASLFGAASGLAACMLSSIISQKQERNHERNNRV